MFVSFRNLCVAVILAGIAARVISIFVLPESAYVDALLNLSAVSKIATEGTLFLSQPQIDYGILLVPMYHILSASLFLASFVPIGSGDVAAYAKVLPAALSALQMLLAYILLRGVFPKNHLFGVAFASVLPWLIRYGAVNYAENLAAVLLLAFFIVLLRYHRAPCASSRFLMAILIASLAFSRIQALIYAVPFCIVFATASIKHSEGMRRALPFLLISVLLAGLWVAFAYTKMETMGYGVTTKLREGFALPEEKLGRDVLDYLRYAVDSHAALYDFPPPESFGRIQMLSSLPAGPLLAAFTLLVLPLTLVMLFGACRIIKASLVSKTLNEPKLCAVLILLAALGFAFFLEMTDPRPIGFIYVRYVIPALPLLAVPLLEGFGALGAQNFLRKVVPVSLVLFALYSLAYTSVSAEFYRQNYVAQQPLFDAVKALPHDAKIYAEVHNRAIAFYTGREIETGQISALPQEEMAQKLREGGIDYIADSCYRSPWGESLSVLAEGRVIELTYSDRCNAIYAVNLR